MDIIKKFEPFFDKWYAESFIGAGSFGRVYKIYREEFGERFYSALKYISIPAEAGEVMQLRMDGMDDESISTYYTEMTKGISAETRLMNKLRGNTNIVSFEDSEIVEKPGGVGYDIFIRMELLTSLPARMVSKPLDRDEVVKLGVDICSALEVCKKYGIIHRDIKPDNIFISDTGDYKLGDFGIARKLEKTATFMSKKGTYNYMAPEVYKGEKYGATCDLYSLGIVMYRLLNKGRLPFMPKAPLPITPDDREDAVIRRMNGEPMPAPCGADEELASIVLKACAYDPKQRFASAEEMKKALVSYSRGEHVDLPGVIAAPIPKEEIADGATEAMTEDDSFKDTADELKTVGAFAAPAAAIAAEKTHGAASAKPVVTKNKEAAPKAEPMAEAEKAKAEVPKKTASSKQTEDEKKKKTGLFIGIAAAALAAVIGLLSAVGVFGKKDGGDKAANADATVPAASVSAPADTEETMITPTPTAEETSFVQTAEPSVTPTALTTEAVTAAPTATHTAAPTATPTAKPTATPTAKPTATATAKPTATATAKPTATPTPTPKPTATPTPKPTATPTPKPTATPAPVQFADSTFEAAFRSRYGFSGPIYESDLLAITDLSLGSYSLTNIQDVAKFKNLTTLSLPCNNISDISPIAGLKNLTTLGLWGNFISNISPISGLTKLTRLSIDHNNISNISSLSGLTRLTQLNLSHNHISDISPLAGLTNLTELWLYENNISNVNPLSGLTKLTLLKIYDNNISNVSPLSGLTKLTTLNLSQNSISNITPLAGLTNLTELWLTYNPLSNDQITWLRQQLPNCSIYF